MPEGPSILILHEVLKPFKGKKVISASGYAKIDYKRLKGKTITDLKTWGKHTLICFKDFTVRIHLLMFGSYLVNKTKKINPKLSLHFTKDDVNFYMSDVKFIDEPLDDIYDWSADIMNKKWSAAKAKKKLSEHPKMMVCDALLDQDIFAGSGNIIKNETLFRSRIHPESLVSSLPPAKLSALLKEVSKYAFDFLKWKKEGTLGKHFQAYEQKECPRCRIPLHKRLTGKGKRQSYFCENCQAKYSSKLKAQG